MSELILIIKLIPGLGINLSSSMRSCRYLANHILHRSDHSLDVHESFVVARILLV